MLTRKVWDHAIEVKEGFVPRKGKIYLLLREEREKVRAVAEKIYLTVKVTTDSTSILCGEEGWKEEDGPEL